jgi:hypothetical protein
MIELVFLVEEVASVFYGAEHGLEGLIVTVELTKDQLLYLQDTAQKLLEENI